MSSDRRFLPRVGPTWLTLCWTRSIPDGGVYMKAIRLHQYHEQPTIDQVDEPKITGPLDVIVRIGGAGLCRTDLHIIEGQWAEISGVSLPYTLGHENAGWVHEIGSAASNVEVGDTGF